MQPRPELDLVEQVWWRAAREGAMKCVQDAAGAGRIRSFILDEAGTVMTEYLVLLGILIGTVLASAALAGGSLAAAWNSWGSYFGSVGGA